jgi:mannitol/fructose-specific phosphotransferase system IIA component (Ntr-type)
VAGNPLTDLSAFVGVERVITLSGSPSKHQALLQLAEATSRHPAVKDRAAFLKAIFDREEVTSTGIGSGVAIPHARLTSISNFVITIGLCRRGVDFSAPDQIPTQVVVMIAGGEKDRTTYLRVLATVASRLKDCSLCKALLDAPDAKTVLERFLANC